MGWMTASRWSDVSGWIEIHSTSDPALIDCFIYAHAAATAHKSRAHSSLIRENWSRKAKTRRPEFIRIFQVAPTNLLTYLLRDYFHKVILRVCTANFGEQKV